MRKQVACLSCRVVVMVPMSQYVKSGLVAQDLGLSMRLRRDRYQVAAFCRGCLLGNRRILQPSTGASSHLGYASALGGIVALGLVSLLVYPSGPDVSDWRWDGLSWPTTGGGVLGVLGVLATALIAMGVDLSRIRERLAHLSSPWKDGERGLHIGDLREANHAIARAEGANAILLVTTSAAIVAGVSSLANGFASQDFDALLTAVAAAVVAAVGVVMGIRSSSISRAEVGVSRAQSVALWLQAERACDAWDARTRGTRVRHVWVMVAVLVLPVLGMLPTTLPRSSVHGAILLQVYCAVTAFVFALAYSATIGRPGACRVWARVLFFFLATMQACLILVVAASLKSEGGWPGFWALVVACSLSAVGVLALVFPATPFGGWWLSYGRRSAIRHRKTREGFAVKGNFLVLSGTSSDLDQLKSLH